VENQRFRNSEASVGPWYQMRASPRPPVLGSSIDWHQRRVSVSRHKTSSSHLPMSQSYLAATFGLATVNVQVGSKCVNLTASICFLDCPDNGRCRSLDDRAGVGSNGTCRLHGVIAATEVPDEVCRFRTAWVQMRARRRDRRRCCRRGS
jgi:hypothetical protein